MAGVTTVQAMTGTPGACVHLLRVSADAWRNTGCPAFPLLPLPTSKTWPRQAFASLPAHFRALCGEVVITVDGLSRDEVQTR